MDWTRKLLLLTIMSGLFFMITGCAKKRVDFAALEKIDAHVHVRYSGPEFFDQASKDNFKAVVIILDHYDIGLQHEYVSRQQETHPGQLVYTTAFPIAGWDEPDWQGRTIELLGEAFDKGAMGVKVWKNIGMEFKDKDGRFVT
ncbi:MAG: hypothetical protein ACETWG_10650, partial [Candidatus Neomarinimicrobiota bacterium]